MNTMPLNINLQQILLHLFNFVILFAILYFLLYKPVKQFMDKRTEYYKKMDDDAKANLESSEKAKNEYISKLSAVEDEISAEKNQARRETEAAAAAKLKKAEEEAADILAEARRNAEQERAKILREAQNEVTDMVASAVEKLVTEASTSEAFDRFLEAAQRGETNE